MVTCSPDVASSTNLGGWINKTGVWSVERPPRLVRGRHRARPAVVGGHQRPAHRARDRRGQPGRPARRARRDLESDGASGSFPSRTLYDPFVSRALEPWSYGIYAGGQSILVGTPSGVTLAPEGGAHQSITTPSIGLEQPGCVAWEPAFAQDLEWCFLHAMDAGRASRAARRPTSGSLPARSTRTLAALPRIRTLRERRRRRRCRAATGARRTIRARSEVTLVGVGAIMPEVIAAAAASPSKASIAGVVCLTSPDLVFRSFQQRRGAPRHRQRHPRRAPPGEHPAPLVTVHDGHPHTLAFLAAPGATGSAASGSPSSASPPTWTTPTACTASTPARSSTPP